MHRNNIWVHWDNGDHQPGYLMALAQGRWGHHHSFPSFCAAVGARVREPFLAREEGKTRGSSRKFEMAVGPRARDGGKPAYALVF